MYSCWNYVWFTFLVFLLLGDLNGIESYLMLNLGPEVSLFPVFVFLIYILFTEICDHIFVMIEFKILQLPD